MLLLLRERESVLTPRLPSNRPSHRGRRAVDCPCPIGTPAIRPAHAITRARALAFWLCASCGSGACRASAPYPQGAYASCRHRTVETLPLNAGAAPAAGKSAADAPTSTGPWQRNLEKATCQVLKQIGSKTQGGRPALEKGTFRARHPRIRGGGRPRCLLAWPRSCCRKRARRCCARTRSRRSLNT